MIGGRELDVSPPTTHKLVRTTPPGRRADHLLAVRLPPAQPRYERHPATTRRFSASPLPRAATGGSPASPHGTRSE
ncbi:predicted protein [Streptomyces viridosporus ATCC 14672]|uniref:Predicted protein n=1 Tax=Streptomyces viridosporus (strain ATCC 14672 / DSM 40746 / JCM 4963 / KCTC 9882 / NRRL B-12104 / FH 1290) TaxID=566461 RepID=D6A3Z1_STRV1|nr:predicted protein [Streptomyces viridosporus ATCC 14672]